MSTKSIFRCKMCGGTLEIQENQGVAECEYCGAKQTLPKLGDERRANLYDRANHLRRNNEFDKAAEIYEDILKEDGTDAEAYWSLVLCRFGIEYVEDPLTKKRVPTVHRAQFTSIFDDDNYKSATEYADMHQRILYEEEAKAINEIQKGILAISEKEEPFDVFICYKETDSFGKRTHDSVLANDLYYQLKEEGFKVFFARITLEDKLGTAYEPYIFAALNSAKVMVVVGTRPEHFQAVWVRNEWSRFLSLIKQGEKKTLIPAYRDMDPYDLPQEFSHLQAQDMSKLGFMQDLIRGIKKISGKKKTAPVATEKVVLDSTAPNVAPLLRRATLFLEDEDFDSADEYAEKVLDLNPECAEAYIIKLLSELNLKSFDELYTIEFSINDEQYFKKALRFATPEYKAKLVEINDTIERRISEAVDLEIYTLAMQYMDGKKYIEAKRQFDLILDFQDSAQKSRECQQLLCEETYEEGKALMEDGQYSSAEEVFANLGDFADSATLRDECHKLHYDITIDRVRLYISQKSYHNAIHALSTIPEHPDYDALMAECRSVADPEECASIYNLAIKRVKSPYVTEADYTLSIKDLEKISFYRDSERLIEEFKAALTTMKNRSRITRTTRTTTRTSSTTSTGHKTAPNEQNENPVFSKVLTIGLIIVAAIFALVLLANL